MRWPQRPFGSRYGPRSMFSIPPAIATSMWPSQISCAADAVAWAPDPQTRLTVSAGTPTGMPPPIAAWRAGFIRLPAWITLPITTVPTRAGSSPERCSVSRITTAPNSVAGVSFSAPLKLPIAVRTGWHNTTSRFAMTFSYDCDSARCRFRRTCTSVASPGTVFTVKPSERASDNIGRLMART